MHRLEPTKAQRHHQWIFLRRIGEFWIFLTEFAGNPGRCKEIVSTDFGHLNRFRSSDHRNRWRAALSGYFERSRKSNYYPGNLWRCPKRINITGHYPPLYKACHAYVALLVSCAQSCAILWLVFDDCRYESIKQTGLHMAVQLRLASSIIWHPDCCPGSPGSFTAARLNSGTRSHCILSKRSFSIHTHSKLSSRNKRDG